MFGNVNSEVFKHLEFVLDAVQGERGHKLEGEHNNKHLKLAEGHVQAAMRELEVYLRGNK